MTLQDFTIRIGFAVLCGFLIGLERQLTGHTAGIRANVLVSLGASLFTLFSIIMEAPDVTRVAAQIVTGVGFLGSGIIIKDGGNVRGINTAATIWCTAAIGVMTSSGYVGYALIATGVLVLINLALRLPAARIRPLKYFDADESTYQITVVCAEPKEITVRSAIMRHLADTPFSLMQLESADVLGGKVEIQATLLGSGRRNNSDAEDLVGRLSLQEGVTSVGWELT